MKKILLLSLLLLSNLSFCQDWEFESPDYDKIEKNITKKKSNLFYELLMDRFSRSDSTMTLEEKRHLYYGYTFSEEYSPYSHSDYADSLKVILEKEKLDSTDYDKIVSYTDLMLDENPFNVRALNYQLYSLDQTKNTLIYDQRLIQLNIIIDALMSSGNGTTKKDAFYVIYTSHEYFLVDVVGLRFGGSQSLIEHFDYLSVVENDAELEGLYFDISPCLKALSDMFKE